MFAGVASIDGNRIRFSFSDWKGILAVKVLRQKFREIMTKGLRYPDREMTSSQNQWLALFFEAVSKAKVEKIGRASTNTTG
jgi:ATP-dependent RNA helicase DHX29